MSIQKQDNAQFKLLTPEQQLMVVLESNKKKDEVICKGIEDENNIKRERAKFNQRREEFKFLLTLEDHGGYDITPFNWRTFNAHKDAENKVTEVKKAKRIGVQPQRYDAPPPPPPPHAKENLENIKSHIKKNGPHFGLVLKTKDGEEKVVDATKLVGHTKIIWGIISVYPLPRNAYNTIVANLRTSKKYTNTSSDKPAYWEPISVEYSRSESEIVDTDQDDDSDDSESEYEDDSDGDDEGDFYEPDKDHAEYVKDPMRLRREKHSPIRNENDARQPKRRRLGNGASLFTRAVPTE